MNMFLLFAFVTAGYRQVWGVLKRNLLIAAMLCLAVCSTLWSVSVTITLQMCLAVGLCTLFACYLSARLTTERLMQLLIFMGLVSALLSIVFVFALPSYGVFQGRTASAWQGICVHKNTLGLSMAFLLTPVFFTNSYKRGRLLLYSGLLLFLIYKSQSRGAWCDTAGMFVFVGCIHLLRRVRAREVTLVLVVMGAAGLATLALGLYFWPVLATSMGKDASMSGRTGIYAEIWRSIMKQPLFGYGFGSFWYAGNPERQRIGLAIRWLNIGYSENGVMELALQVGFVGVGLLFAMLGRAAVQGIRLLRSPYYSPRVGWFLTILFLAALTNIDAGWFMTADTLDWVLIVVSCVGLNEHVRLLYKDKASNQPEPHRQLARS